MSGSEIHTFLFPVALTHSVFRARSITGLVAPNHCTTRVGCFNIFQWPKATELVHSFKLKVARSDTLDMACLLIGIGVTVTVALLHSTAGTVT